MDVPLEAGIVAWLTNDGSSVNWPVIVQSRQRSGLYRVRLLGAHEKQTDTVLGRESCLRAFASNIHYVTVADGPVRRRMVAACGVALDYIRDNGHASQRALTDDPGLRRLLSALDPCGDTSASERYARAVVEQESGVRQMKKDVDWARREVDSCRLQLREAQNSVVTAKNREKVAMTKLERKKDILARGEDELQQLRDALKEATMLRFEPAAPANPHASRHIAVRARPRTNTSSPHATGTDSVGQSTQRTNAAVNTGRAANGITPNPSAMGAGTGASGTAGNGVEAVVGGKLSMSSASVNDKRHIEETVLEEGRESDVMEVIPGPGKEVVDAVVERIREDGDGRKDSVSSTASVGSPRVDDLPTGVYNGAVDGPVLNIGSDVGQVQGPATPTTTSSGGSGSRSSGRPSKALAPRGMVRHPNAVEGSPLERVGKKLRVGNALPLDSPYMIALKDLGRRAISKALRNMALPPHRERSFNADLRAYQRESGWDVEAPLIGGVKLDVFKLTSTLLEVGGMENTIRMRALTFVFRKAGLDYANSFYTNQIKKFYVYYVLPYEHHLVHGTPPPKGTSHRIMEESARKRNTVK